MKHRSSVGASESFPGFEISAMTSGLQEGKRCIPINQLKDLLQRLVHHKLIHQSPVLIAQHAGFCLVSAPLVDLKEAVALADDGDPVIRLHQLVHGIYIDVIARGQDVAVHGARDYRH